MKRVSVLMPAYNAEDSVGAAISSVLAQTYGDVELVVVDDGSSDRTPDICAAFGDRITFVRTENHGVAHARNTAAAAATGDYITLCDADDQLLPPAIATGVARLEAQPRNTIVTNEALVLTSTGLSHRRHLIRGNVPAAVDQRLAILERNFVGIFSVFRRGLWDDLGGQDPSLRQLEDWDLWLRAIYDGWRVTFQPVPVALYRLTTNSLSTRGDRFNAEHDLLHRFRDQCGDVMTERERDYLDARLTSASPTELRQAGSDALGRGEIAEARRIYRQLAILTPTNTRVRVRAQVAAAAPGAAHVLSWRQRRLHAALGSRVLGSTIEGERDGTTV